MNAPKIEKGRKAHSSSTNQKPRAASLPSPIAHEISGRARTGSVLGATVVALTIRPESRFHRLIARIASESNLGRHNQQAGCYNHALISINPRH